MHLAILKTQYSGRFKTVVFFNVNNAKVIWGFETDWVAI